MSVHNGVTFSTSAVQGSATGTVTLSVSDMAPIDRIDFLIVVEGSDRQLGEADSTTPPDGSPGPWVFDKTILLDATNSTSVTPRAYFRDGTTFDADLVSLGPMVLGGGGTSGALTLTDVLTVDFGTSGKVEVATPNAVAGVVLTNTSRADIQRKSDRLVIAVGNGTTVPPDRLTILNDGSGSFPGAFTFGTGASFGQGTVVMNGGTTIRRNLGANSSAILVVGDTDGTNHLVLNGMGHVGIKCPSPAVELDMTGIFRVQGSAGGVRITDTGSEGRIYSLTTGNGAYPLRLDGYPVRIYSGGSQVAVFDTTGHLGLGTSSPGFPIHLVSNRAGSDRLRFDFTGNGTLDIVGYDSSVGSAYAGAIGLFANDADALMMAGPGKNLRFVTHDGSDYVERGRFHDGGTFEVNALTKTRSLSFNVSGYDASTDPAVFAGGDIAVQTSNGSGWPSVYGTVVQFGGSVNRNFQFFFQKDQQTLKMRTCYSSGVWQGWRTFAYEDNTPTRGSGVGDSYRLQTDYGYIDVGPQNTGWCHFATDRANFHFSKGVHVAGQLKVYNANVYLDSGTSRVNGLQIDGGMTKLRTGSTYDPVPGVMILSAAPTSSDVAPYGTLCLVI